MKVREVTCRRIRNLGNFESETVEMVGVVDDGEDPIEAYESLRFKVKAALGFRKEREQYEDSQ